MGQSIRQAKAGNRKVAKRAAKETPMDGWGLDRVVVSELWKRATGDHGNEAERDGSLKGFEMVVADHARELAGLDPTAIEMTLARVAAVNQAFLHVYDLFCVSGIGSDMSLATFEKLHRRADRAHRRLMSTLRTLETVRKLAVPTVQINVAEQQVNQIHAAAGDMRGGPLLACDGPKAAAAIPGPRARSDRRGGRSSVAKKGGRRD